MTALTRFFIFVAMVLFAIVSMWTTYKSLHDSVFPDPAIDIPLGVYGVWHCSLPAIGLSVAIGFMLLALKIAIIDEQKRLTPLGLAGLTIVASISIAFNMDVLYRVADQEFYLRYCTSRVKDTYGKYLAEVRTTLENKKRNLETYVALQEGELESEIRGLRTAPPGYGPLARGEDYALTLLRKTSAVDLQAIEEALLGQQQADELLQSERPGSVEEAEQLQDKLRVAVLKPGAVAGLTIPDPVRLESPLFAVFSRLLDIRTIGVKEIIILVLAFLLDLADILGYTLVPNRPRRPRRSLLEDRALFGEPEIIPEPASPQAAATSNTPVLGEEGAEEHRVSATAGLKPRMRRSGRRFFRLYR